MFRFFAHMHLKFAKSCKCCRIIRLCYPRTQNLMLISNSLKWFGPKKNVKCKKPRKKCKNRKSNSTNLKSASNSPFFVSTLNFCELICWFVHIALFVNFSVIWRQERNSFNNVAQNNNLFYQYLSISVLFPSSMKH
jgi:hypothetical protein